MLLGLAQSGTPQVLGSLAARLGPRERLIRPRDRGHDHRGGVFDSNLVNNHLGLAITFGRFGPLIVPDGRRPRKNSLDVNP
jgi:hypothetical protein